MQRYLATLLPSLLILSLAGCDSTPSVPEGDLITEDLVVGTGEEASVGDGVMVAFRGTLEDGTLIEVSDNEDPFSFTVGVGQVIDGWDLGLVGMKGGGTRKLTIPPHLAFGSEGRCTGGACLVPPNATVIFEITLIRVLKSPFLEERQLGDGAELQDGMFALFGYVGALSDGTVFDSSILQGGPLEILLGSGQVIPGLEQGMRGMRVGGIRTVVIPSHLAYGEDGFGVIIPPYSVLRFTIELFGAANP